MTPLFAPDVSEFQAPVDDRFNREWLIFRLCFDGTIDPRAEHTLAWAMRARAAGRIRGFTGYVVPLAGFVSNDRCFAVLDHLGYPHDAPAMVDAEKWRGQPYEIFGDHSAQFNQLATRIRSRQGAVDMMAWAYGNQGPDLEVWPDKADWLGWLVANYTSGPLLPRDAVPNMIGQQYTDGEPQYDAPDRPHSTPPFGRCDHNVLYRLPGDDMLTDDDIHRIVLALKAADIGDETLASAVRETHDAVAALTDTAKAQGAALAKLTAAVAHLQTTGGTVTLEGGTVHLAGDVTVVPK